MSLDFRARKRFGQNFLVDGGAVARIVRALAASEDEPLVEIGPGRGVLTAALLSRRRQMAAVELDRDLVAELATRFDPERLVLIEGDVLSVPLHQVQARMQTRAPLVIVGNLPYNISKPIAMKLITERLAVERAVLMFQREVAERLIAEVGAKSYGPLTILAGTYYSIERLFDLPPAAFRPRPSVVSTVTRWVPRPVDPERHSAWEGALRECLRSCFQRRRQTLLNNVRAAVGSDQRARELLTCADLDGSRRPQQISPEGYHRLATHWPRSGGGTS